MRSDYKSPYLLHRVSDHIQVSRWDHISTFKVYIGISGHCPVKQETKQVFMSSQMKQVFILLN
jgi:hypothetical protein